MNAFPTRIVALVLLLTAGPTAVLAQDRLRGAACSADAVRQQVCDVDDSLRTALLRADTAALARLYAEEVRTTNYRGVTSTKSMLLHAIGSGTLRFDTLQVRQRSVEVHGDSAVVAGSMHQVAAGPEGNHPLEIDYRRTYVRRDGRWQLLATVIRSANR